VTGQETSGVVVKDFTTQTVEITEQAVADIRKLDDSDAAAILDRRLIELERMAKRSFVEMGLSVPR
jgi:hypothetical protein